MHFLIVGALLFGAYEWLNRSATLSDAEGPVKIGQGELRWLRKTFTNQWQRAPSGAEMNDLVARLLEEELLAREARTLGLDQNDTIVRRRLAQKLAFLVDDTLRIADPGEIELRRFYAEHSGRYLTEPQVSFKQIFFSPHRRSNADKDARLALALVVSGRRELPSDGDPLPLEVVFADIDRQAVSNVFGTAFARAVFALPAGSWSGPIKSAFGLHLVRVTRQREARARAFEDVRMAVMEDWRRHRQSETKQAYLAKLRDKYGVVIDESPSLIQEHGPQKQAKR